jgi:signal transduction histidine kinase/CheY-like chemotaxis protein
VNESQQPLAEQSFLILAPTGRDGAVTIALLEQAGMTSRLCADVQELCRCAESEGALALMIAEEALVSSALARLRELLARQESWSDLPILVFTSRCLGRDPHPLTARIVEALGNVSLLDRPLRPITMLAAANAARRTRQRQYLARAELLEQQRAIRQRDQFLAMLGHELRNPLAAITMAMQLELQGDDGAHYRDVVRRQTKPLTRLDDDLLDVSRVTSGKIALQREPLSVRELVERSIQSVRPMLDAQRLSLRVQLPDPSPQVNADAVRLEQIVVNLLANAAKYTPPGGHVEVRVAQQEGQVCITVSDDGVGISAEMLPRVFDLFTQAEATIDRAKGGMGIGLTLVRSLVELHGGRVQTQSAGLGKGSSFTVQLPALAEPQADPARGEARDPEPVPPCDVLIVEDNDDSRELLSSVLARLGHRVSAAADGQRGVEEALHRRPRVLLVDIGLPTLDGYEVARTVRRELGREPYLVALTGYGQPEDRARALAAGFDVHLTKPVDLALLQRLLNQSSLATAPAAR